MTLTEYSAKYFVNYPTAEPHFAAKMGPTIDFLFYLNDFLYHPTPSDQLFFNARKLKKSG